ncbi:hypothetical protein ACFLQ2_00685 [archaeon]
MGRGIAVAIFITMFIGSALALGGPHQETLTYSSATYSTVTYTCDTSDDRCSWSIGCGCSSQQAAFDKNFGSATNVQTNGNGQVKLYSYVNLSWPLKGDTQNVTEVFFEARTQYMSSSTGGGGSAGVWNYDSSTYQGAVSVASTVARVTNTNTITGATANNIINKTNGKMRLSAYVYVQRGWTAGPDIYEIRATNMTYSYNYLPVIESFTGPSGDKKPGNSVTFTVSDWNDTDGDYGKVRVCKTGSIDGGNCSDGDWCTTTGWVTAPGEMSCSYTVDGTENETNEYHVFVCDDYDWSCSQAEQGNFSMVFGPYAESVAISPEVAYRNSNLTGSGNYGDVNNNTQNGSVRTWWVNGAMVKNESLPAGDSYNSSTLTAAEGGYNVGDNVKFGFKACNNISECAPMKNATIEIINAVPVVETTEEDKYYLNQDIAIGANIYSPDEDALNVTWEWWLNGNSTAGNVSTLTQDNNYTRGDNVTYQVSATDGADTTNSTSTITIANYEPQFQSHAITNPAYRGTDLSCTWIVTDIEENNFTVTAKWYKNSVHTGEWDCSVSCLNNTPCSASITVPGANVSFGDEFICEASASDGIDSTSSNATRSAEAKCGDGIIEGGESCEGVDLNGQTCGGLGYASGTLSCSGSCTFDTSKCSSGGSGDPGGPGGSSGSSDTGGGAPPTVQNTTAEPLEELLIEIELPMIEEEEPVQEPMATPTGEPSMDGPPSSPGKTPNPKTEKADFTGLVAFATGPFAWGALLFLVAALFYVKRGAITAAVPKVPVKPAAKTPMPILPRKFPASPKRRADLVKGIANSLQGRNGKFHAAGIWRELHSAYGDTVVRDRIYIEKEIGEWLKDNADFTESYRNAKYYKFKPSN